ncbi:nucleotidyltransferase [Dyadobacter arcticus]|uniref:Adenylyl/Guanylyl and SMODS C-terminal sensor domain-containing protein n=1 Tax=Dyadobacter arcticus TaxID=1078754 RepID=A0ABX0UM85_9BACT|nr:nucleotidyltransferase [Dyadobacter arcticus]NIJ52191.1 hypothetical protein [Dyadobacter arcticus]
MKLTNYFKHFLENEVNLNSTRIDTLDDRTEAITNFLKNSQQFKDKFLDIIPQGSYAHKTIIKPLKVTDEYDADVLLYIKEFEDWEACDYVNNLFKTFKGSIYEDKASRKTRCVTIKYANDFHLDIVPYLERHGEKYVTNRHEDLFELTDPEKFTEWLDDKNRITKHHFVKVVRLIKFLRDYKRTFSIKSIILSTLLGEQVNDIALLEDPKCYEDVPTALYTILGKLRSYMQNNYYMPTISDPGETGENFGDRWDQDGWLVFRNKIIDYSEKVTDAYEETDLQKSLSKWQKIFGEDFKKPDEKRSMERRLPDGTLIQFDNTEQYLSDVGLREQINVSYTVQILGRVAKKDGYMDYKLANRGSRVKVGRSLSFGIKCNVPWPYEVYWKTLNRGQEALRHNSIRGQIVKGSITHSEVTKFRGNHFVEVYIVKNGVCVAKDRQSVMIV